MADEPDPPRKYYTLKPREFEVVNPRVRAPDPATGKSDPGAIDVRELFKSARADPEQRVLSPGPQPVIENDVHAILRENHAHAEAAGLNRLAPKPVHRRRRAWDYFVLLMAGNLFIAVVYGLELFLGFQVQCLAAHMPEEFWNLVKYTLHHPAVFAMAGVGMVFFSGCLTWLMFGVMDDY
jgi:hypothetical protein